MKFETSVSWKDCNGDLSSDISLEVLRQELLELIAEYEKQKEGEIDELQEVGLSLVEMSLPRITEILGSLLKKDPATRKKFEKIYQESISKELDIIYNCLS